MPQNLWIIGIVFFGLSLLISFNIGYGDEITGLATTLVFAFMGMTACITGAIIYSSNTQKYE